MTTTSLSKLLRSAVFFFAVGILPAALAETTECKQGICCHVGEVIRDGYALKAVWFTGMPRAGDYVTHFYQVRGLPNSPGQQEIWPDNSQQFVLTENTTISIQACRNTNKIISPTVCTGWVTFTVEVSPKPVAPTSTSSAGNVLADGIAGANDAIKSGTAVVHGATPAKPVHKVAKKPTADSVGHPIIDAHPTVVKIPPGQEEGRAMITWDAGKDHPYAELWVKTEDEDEKRLTEKGKGWWDAKVKPGRNVFILSDFGQQLATVVVEGKQQ